MTTGVRTDCFPEIIGTGVVPPPRNDVAVGYEQIASLA